MPTGRVIIAAGRLTKQKGFDRLITAFSKFQESDVTLVVLGEGPDRGYLENLIVELGLHNRVLLPGFVSEPHIWFHHSVCFVLSSRWEGFGHVLVEAMAMSCPVIAIDCPHGPRDIIAEKDHGVLLPDDNLDALTNAMRQVVTDTNLREQLKVGGYERSVTFSIPIVSERYLALLDSLCIEGQ